MGEKSWGTPLAIKQYEVVAENEEIPKGNYAYVFSQQASEYNWVKKSAWEAMLNGDFSLIKQKIETEIPNTKVQWIRVSWTKAWLEFRYDYRVEGFKIEAIVKNESGANLTGLEIAIIIMAVAFLATVITFVALTAWITWKVVTATEEAFGDVGTIAVGGGLILVFLLFLLLILGVGIEYRKGKGVKVGKR